MPHSHVPARGSIRRRRRTCRRGDRYADDVARAGAGPAGRPRNLAQPGARRGVCPQTGRTRPLSGVTTAIGLVLDSGRPPCGPPAPRSSRGDDAARCAGSRPRTGPAHPPCQRRYHSCAPRPLARLRRNERAVPVMKDMSSRPTRACARHGRAREDMLHACPAGHVLTTTPCPRSLTGHVLTTTPCPRSLTGHVLTTTPRPRIFDCPSGHVLTTTPCREFSTVPQDMSSRPRHAMPCHAMPCQRSLACPAGHVLTTTPCMPLLSRRTCPHDHAMPENSCLSHRTCPHDHSMPAKPLLSRRTCPHDYSMPAKSRLSHRTYPHDHRTRPRSRRTGPPAPLGVPRRSGLP
jgi:hypothetical protein